MVDLSQLLSNRTRSSIRYKICTVQPLTNPIDEDTSELDEQPTLKNQRTLKK